MNIGSTINKAATTPIDPEAEVAALMAQRKAMEEQENRLREGVNSVLEESSMYNRLVNGLVAEYVEQLDSFSDSMDKLVREIRKGEIANYSDLQLEMRTLVLAQALHKASDGLGVIGGQSDVARMNREQKFAEVYKGITKGTIPDKKAEAEEYVIEEKQIEAIFQRAYQVLASKVKSGNRVLEAVKKVLSSRMIASEVFRKELSDSFNSYSDAAEDLLTGEEIDDGTT